MNKRIIYFIFLVMALVTFAGNMVQGQSITLKQVIAYAQSNSPEALKIKTYKENKYWQWKTYKAEYKPQLVLNSSLPNYMKTNVPVRQEDGSIQFRTIDQSNSYFNMSLEQNIGLTGGKIYFSSDLNRLDDFLQESTSYNGSLFYIGFEQPLFAYNNLKWMKKIEPLKYDESLKEYLEEKERIAYNTTYKYFNLLMSQIHFEVAMSNKANADTMYSIGLEKFNMGKISKNELLQLKHGVITAKKSMAQAELSIKTTQLELLSYTGLESAGYIDLLLPNNYYQFAIDDTLAVSKAMENSKQSLVFKRQILEAKRENERANRESRLNAKLSLSYGNTNMADQVHMVYHNPKDMRTFNVGVSIPIMDWGRGKSKRKTAEGNLKLVEYTVKQDIINFEQEVLTEVENFRMLQSFIEYTEEADITASERYEIARLRYISGDISLTEYNIALEEKDRAKQDYISALNNYWLTYYMIRMLTLYDFNNNTILNI